MKLKKLFYLAIAAFSFTLFVGLASQQPAMAKSATTPTSLRGAWHRTTTKSRYVMIIKKHSMTGWRYSKTLHKVVNKGYVKPSQLYVQKTKQGFYNIGLKQSDAVQKLKAGHYKGQKVLIEHLGFFDKTGTQQLWFRGK